MTTSIQLIVGLGNPGAEYEATRHNAGAWYVQHLAKQYGIRLAAEKKFFGIVGKGNIQGHTCTLLIPTTFMNRSGQAVAAIAQFYKLNPQQILVAHDELDLPVGSAKLKQGGGHGGQNGLRDIISRLGNNKDFHRLRLGIGHPGHRDLVTGHVLGKPSNVDQQCITRCIEEAITITPDLLSDQVAKAMNRLHSFKG